MPRVISLILGGGRGTRLFPLTKSRSKPAVPIAGKYRLIDIPVSNCIHSGLNRIFVLTQFNSVSLHRHIYNTYKFDPFSGGFVEILAAQQTMEHESWYQGTADAVRRNIPYFTESNYDLVLILSGDQLYRMDFQDMIRTHLENKAAVTIAALPVAEPEAKACGIMKIQADGRVVDFEEKPKTPEKLGRRPNRAGLAGTAGLERGRPPLPRQHGHLSLQSLAPGRSAQIEHGHRFRPRALAADDRQAPRSGPPVRRLLGRYRNGGGIPPGQYRPDRARTRRSISPRRRDRSSPGLGSFPARESPARPSKTA